MKKVVTFGVFDYFHLGHLRLFKRCKEKGDYLIVAIHDDNHVKVNKPECDLYYTQQERMEMISEIRCVDKVIFYDQVDETIKRIDFDTLIVGPDQINHHFQAAIKYCNEHNKEVIVLPRTPNISSTDIKIYKND